MLGAWFFKYLIKVQILTCALSLFVIMIVHIDFSGWSLLSNFFDLLLFPYSFFRFFLVEPFFLSYSNKIFFNYYFVASFFPLFHVSFIPTRKTFFCFVHLNSFFHIYPLLLLSFELSVFLYVFLSCFPYWGMVYVLLSYCFEKNHSHFLSHSISRLLFCSLFRCTCLSNNLTWFSLFSNLVK